MLDSYSKNEVNINAISGTITKNYVKSYFRQFHLQSEVAKSLFGANPTTIILQMMVAGEMTVIAELISIKDFEEYLAFKREEK